MLKFSNYFKAIEKTDRVYMFGSYEYTEWLVAVGKYKLRAMIPSKYTCEFNVCYKTRQMYLTGGYAKEEGVRYDKAIIRIESFTKTPANEEKKAEESFRARPVFKCIGHLCPPVNNKIINLPPSYDPAYVFTAMVLNERGVRFPIKCIAFGSRANQLVKLPRNSRMEMITHYTEACDVGEYKVIHINVSEYAEECDFSEEVCVMC